MDSKQRIEESISIILNLGLILSIILAGIGGFFYLWQSGGQLAQTEIIQSNIFGTSLVTIMQNALTFAPLAIIQLGILIFVITQILRVGLLAVFYIVTGDYWFIFFSLFILFTLIYSLVWQTVSL